MTLLVPAWIAQLSNAPAAMALAVPPVPSTEAGAYGKNPQQTTPPVPAWIAQLWSTPAEMALAVPLVPSTEAGGEAWFTVAWRRTEKFEPQQTTLPVPAWIAQLCLCPTAIALAVPLVPSTDGGGEASPSPFNPQQITLPVPAWIAQL